MPSSSNPGALALTLHAIATYRVAYPIKTPITRVAFLRTKKKGEYKGGPERSCPRRRFGPSNCRLIIDGVAGPFERFIRRKNYLFSGVAIMEVIVSGAITICESRTRRTLLSRRPLSPISISYVFVASSAKAAPFISARLASC